MKKNLLRYTLVFSLALCATNVKSQAVFTQSFVFTGGPQTFTVPNCVQQVTIEARGAQGGSLTVYGTHPGGLGAIMRGTFTVTPNSVLDVIVGQRGNFDPSSSGGGGGSGVNSGTVPLIVAGGGGGVDFQQPNYDKNNAALTTSAHVGQSSGGAAGLNGSDGGDAFWGSTSTARGGRGWLFSPIGSLGLNGITSAANTTTVAGTWGLGGGGGTVGYAACNCGGGGGGYSGGGAGSINNSGGGGGSYNAGTNQNNTVSNTGHGMVIFYYSTELPMTPSVSPVAGICTGGTATLLAMAGLNTYTWNSSAASNSSITVSPTSNTSYTVSGTSSQGCVYKGVVTVSVSSQTPTTSINASATQVCLGKTVTLTATGGLVYNWSPAIQNGVGFAPSTTQTYTVTTLNGCGSVTSAVTVSIGPLPVAVAASPTTGCYGQPVTLTAISSATGYTWSPNISVNAATVIVTPTSTTVYSLTVSDGTCLGTAQLSLPVNPVPTLNIATSATAVCANSPVSMTVTGADTYSWSHNSFTTSVVTFTPSSATLFSVAGTNSLGCTVWINQVVITKPSPTLNLVASATLACAGDQITLQANSNSTAYAWSTSGSGSVVTVNPLTTTGYTVTGSAFGCSVTQSVEVAVFTPTASITGATAVCSGKSATLTASGADSYNWVNISPMNQVIVTPAANTTYTLIVTTTSDNVTCNNEQYHTVSLLPAAAVSITPSPSVICRGGETMTLSATGGNSYTWTANNATTTAVTFSSSTVGTFPRVVNGVDANGCAGSFTYQVKVSSCTGIEEKGELETLRMFPNPTSGAVTISADRNMQLHVLNQIGQRVQVISLNAENNHSVQIKDLAAGVYYVTTPDLQFSRKLIVVN